MSDAHPLAGILADSHRGPTARTLSVAPDGGITIVPVPLGLSFETVYLGAGGRSTRLDPPAIEARLIAPGITLLWSGGERNSAALHLLRPQSAPWEVIDGTAAILRIARMQVADLSDAEILWFSALLGGYTPESGHP